MAEYVELMNLMISNITINVSVKNACNNLDFDVLLINKSISFYLEIKLMSLKNLLISPVNLTVFLVLEREE